VDGLTEATSNLGKRTVAAFVCAPASTTPDMVKQVTAAITAPTISNCLPLPDSPVW
jgi:hypothetical protein